MNSDGWLCVARYLTVRELCALMQVNREWFFMWVTDRMWGYQKHRVVSEFPALQALFETHANDAAEHIARRSMKSNGNKKRKTAWIMPRRGIWYVFKRWLSMGFNMGGFRRAFKSEDLKPLAIAAIRAHLPNHENICVVTEAPLFPKFRNDRQLLFYYKPFGLVRFTFSLKSPYLSILFGLEKAFVTGIDIYNYFKGWQSFVLQTRFIPLWLPSFELDTK